MIKLVRLRTPAEVGLRAAQIVAETVERRPQAVLALPTGNTPRGMYAELGRMHDRGLDFSGVTTFMLDEYVGVARDNRYSFTRYLDEHFYTKVNVSPTRRHGFDSLCADTEAECRRYDRAIAEAGGFDLAILGIGSNGHVAFNEPGEFFSLASHIQKLADDTIYRNSGGLTRGEQAGDLEAGLTTEFPTHAMTVGMGAVLNARSLLMLAMGEAKTGAIAEMMNGLVTTRLPASLLQIHDDCSLLADPAAAGGLGYASAEKQDSYD